MAKDPAFLFYPADFMIGTALMSHEQRGKYVSLLCYQHQMGHLTKEDMMTVCGSEDEKIFSKFKIDPEGRYYNERLEEEKTKRKNFCESRRTNASTSKAYAKHMENENVNESSSFGKCENLFFGPVPEDIIDLTGRLLSGHSAGQWQDYVKSELENIGYEVVKEVPCIIDEDQNGRLDLVAKKGILNIAIECDYRTPRKKSILKVQKYPIGIVILRDPKIIPKEPAQKKLIKKNKRPAFYVAMEYRALKWEDQDIILRLLEMGYSEHEANEAIGKRY